MPQEVTAKSFQMNTERRWIEYGGNYFVHTFTYLVPADEYFNMHPEYFPEINGECAAKHLYNQLCFTNKNVLNIVTDKMKDWLHANPNAKIVSISKQGGTVRRWYTDTFCNAVADSIKEEFPDVAVDTLAYQYSLTPSRSVEIRDNVIIRYCTGACSVHPLGQCESYKQYSRWAKI